MNNTITASRMNLMTSCARASFWRHEIGLVKVREVDDSLALQIGSSWARAMEARWLGASYLQALEEAIPEGVRMDMFTVHIVAALLAAHYIYYGQHEIFDKVHPEVRFGPVPIEGTDFIADGVMDGLGVLKDQRLAIAETKTTGSSLEPDSDYWDRLNFNVQVLQYVTEAPGIGWNVDVAFYDVMRKPTIKPKEITDLDRDGKKIVIDMATGKRAMKEVGKKGAKQLVPRESGGEGFMVKKHTETPDEFGNRLFKDALFRPEFYFARKEIPVTHDKIKIFKRHRYEMAKLIEHFRNMEQRPDGWPSDQDSLAPRDSEAWPRNVSKESCKFCSYRSFCLQHITPDLNRLPQGFAIQPPHPELEREEQKQYDTTEEDAAAAAD